MASLGDLKHGESLQARSNVRSKEKFDKELVGELDGVESLVNELLKDLPDEKLVQRLMKKHSLPCPQGRVERMKLVLDLLGGRWLSEIPG